MLEGDSLAGACLNGDVADTDVAAAVDCVAVADNHVVAVDVVLEEEITNDAATFSKGVSNRLNRAALYSILGAVV